MTAAGCGSAGMPQGPVAPSAKTAEPKSEEDSEKKEAAKVMLDCPADELEQADSFPPTPKESWQWDCPETRAKAVEHTPVTIVDDLAVLYRLFVNDHLDGYGQWGGAVREYPKSDRRKILCAWLAGGHWDAFEKAQEGTVADGPEECVRDVPLKRYQGRFTYELSRLEDGRYLVGRIADTTKAIDENDGYQMEITIEGGLVVTDVSQRAFRCQLDPQDQCRYFDPDDGKGARSLCFDDQTACVPAEFSSSVYVTDLRSGASAEFGLFHRRQKPAVLVDETEISVVAGECRQVAKLPLAKGCSGNL